MSDPNALSLQPYTALLHRWVAEVVQGQRWKQYDDLHVDVLGPQFRAPGRWVEAGQLLLTALLEIVDRHLYDVLLAVPLAFSTTPTAVDALPEQVLEGCVGDTPPSCYVFPLDFSAFAATVQAAVPWPALGSALKREVYFQETWEDDGYERVLFIKAANTGNALGSTLG